MGKIYYVLMQYFNGKLLPITVTLTLLKGPRLYRRPSWKMDVQWDSGCFFKTLSSPEYSFRSVYGKQKYVFVYFVA